MSYLDKFDGNGAGQIPADGARWRSVDSYSFWDPACLRELSGGGEGEGSGSGSGDCDGLVLGDGRRPYRDLRGCGSEGRGDSGLGYGSGRGDGLGWGNGSGCGEGYGDGSTNGSGRG